MYLNCKYRKYVLHKYICSYKHTIMHLYTGDSVYHFLVKVLFCWPAMPIHATCFMHPWPKRCLFLGDTTGDIFHFLHGPEETILMWTSFVPRGTLARPKLRLACYRREAYTECQTDGSKKTNVKMMSIFPCCQKTASGLPCCSWPSQHVFAYPNLRL